MRQIRKIKHWAWLLVLSCVSLSGFAQIEPNSIYNYYNNDSFDAFLNIDVDSIKYSNIDIYGKEHNDIVTQEIWTQDSVYRIPLNNIDSICFRAPEIKLRDSVFFITNEHIPYLLTVDTLSLIFDSSIPGNLLPEVGQVIVNDTFEEPLQDGFAGRVTAINTTDEGIELVCEDVVITDIFERLSLVGKVVSASEEEVAAYHAKQRARLRSSDGEHWWDLYTGEDATPVYLGDKKVTVLDGLFFAQSKRINGVCRWYIDVNLLNYIIDVDLTLNHPDIEYGLDMKFPKLWDDLMQLFPSVGGSNDEEKKTNLLDKFKIPIEIVPGVLDLELAPILDISGDVEVKGTAKTAGIQRVKFDVRGSTINPMVPIMVPKKCSFEKTKKTELEASLSFNESVDFGLEGRVVVKVVCKRLLSITGAIGFGLNAKGKLALSSDMIDEEEGGIGETLYNVLDGMKADLSIYVQGYIKTKVAGLNILGIKKVNRMEYPFQTVYLFPKLSAPKLNEYPNNQSMLPLSVSSDVSRDLILKCHPGLRLLDENGMVVRDVMSSQPYRIQDLWYDRNLQLDLSGLPPGSYTCKPNFHYTIWNFDGRVDIPNVSSTIVVPEAMTLSEQSVTMVEKDVKTVQIIGGWGDYTIENSNSNAVNALISPAVFTPGIHHLIIKGCNKGNATIKITDVRTGAQKILAVKVDPEDEIPGSTITTDSYEISEDGTTLIKWLGDEKIINMSTDPVLSRVSKIQGSAFANNTNITSIVIPPSVVEIGNTVFDNCTNLAIVKFQDGDKTLTLGYDHYNGYGEGVGLFQDCQLKSVYIGRNLSFDGNRHCGYSPFYKNATLSKVIFGNNVNADVADNMFLNCGALQSVTISDRIGTIGGSAFNGCSSLINVSLPKNLIVIGGSAFANCRNLLEISLPTKLERIEGSAFANCSSLGEIIFPPSVKAIGNTAFDNCTNIAKVFILEGTDTLALGYDHYNGYGEGVGLFQDSQLKYVYIGRNLKYDGDRHCGYSPFHKNPTLKNVQISDNVTMDIPDNMFLNCTALKTVKISKVIKNIKGSAFNGCSSLTEVTLPTNLISLGGSSFANCSSLTTISFPEKLETIGSSAFANCSGLKYLNIPPSVVTIENTAFDNCSNIERIVIREGVKTLTLGYDHYNGYGEGVGLFQDSQLKYVYIGRELSYNGDRHCGYSPFHKNGTLKNVIISDNVTMDIPDNMFLNCKALEKVVISNKIKNIKSSAFNGCSSLEEVSLPDNLEAIYGSAFANCGVLPNILLPNKLVSIGGSSFANCSNLGFINLPPSVKEIGNTAFDNCGSITKVIIKDSPDTLKLGYDHYNGYGEGVGLFQDSPLNAVYIGRNLSYNGDRHCGYSPFHKNATLSMVRFSDNVTMDIPDNMFLNCKALESVNFSNQTQRINGSVFNGCSALTKVFLPENLTYLGGSVFANCSSLTEISLPGQLETISGSAFANCSNLAYITIPPSVKEIGNTAFDNCGSITKVIIKDSPDTLKLGYDHYNGYGEGVGLFQDSPLNAVYIGRNLSYNGDRHCGYSPFHKNATLSMVRFSDNVTMDIPDNMFLNCKALESVNFSNQTQRINGSVFNGCSALTKVFLPENLTYLGGSVFANCSSLTEISLPEQLETISGSAFANCSNLANITIPPSVKEIGNTAFDNCGSLSSVAFEDGVEALTLGYDHYNGYGEGVGLFQDCPLTTVYIGRLLNYDGDRHCGYSPFHKNSTLHSAELCNRFQTIPNNLFRSCSNLKKLTVRRSSPPEIGGGAFDGVPKEDATLYVPRNSVSSYQSAEGWCDFGTITYIH